MPINFHRRIFLKRALKTSSFVVGMPLLECMLNDSGTAYANGNPLETLYGTFFMGNGKARGTWVPTNSAGNLDPNWNSASDDPLRPIIEYDCKADVSVITGLNSPNLRNGPHKHAQSLSLSGGVGTRDGDKSFADATIDQIVAEYYTSESIVASCCRRVSNNANNLERFISWRRVDVPNSPILDPKQLFNSLFSLSGPGTGGADPALVTKKSILDQVRRDIQNLKNQGISNTDQLRLDEHLAAVRSLEQQIDDFIDDSGASEIETLAQDIDDRYPSGFGVSYTNGVINLSNTAQHINARWDIICKITALALSSGRRPAFALAFTHAGDQTPLPVQVNFPTRGTHSLAHTAQDSAQEDMKRVTTYQVEQFCKLVNTLQAHQDVTGNRLIDRAVVLGTSELDYGYGAEHFHNDIPMLLAGRANGRLRTGIHLNANGKQVGNAGLTALQAALGETADFRTPNGHVAKPDAPLEGLLDFSGTL